MMHISIKNLFIYVLIYFLNSNVRCLDVEPILGGETPKIGDIRYLVSFQINGTHVCGGGIISNNYVVTAAHCVVDTTTGEFKNGAMQVLAGVVYLHSKNGKRIKSHVRKIYVPSAYNSSRWTLTSTPEGDIAVLQLKRSLNLKHNRHLKKLVLPDVDNGNYKSFEGERAVIAGFGWNKVEITSDSNYMYETGSSDYRLHSTEVNVISNSDCDRRSFEDIVSTLLCGDFVDRNDTASRGVCRGDSGSPLVYDSSTIIGVASANEFGCNGMGTYTRVSSFVQFIKNAQTNVTDDMRVREL